MNFRAFRVTIDPELKHTVETVDEAILPNNSVLIKVHYSSLNYKDALSASGNKGVTKNYPHTPGIDAAGVIVDSHDPKWHPGDRVLVTGFDLGMNTYGGFSEYIRVPSEWIVKCPEALDLREAMCFGTAGFTAALSVAKIIENVPIEAGEILVTGATGGVGSVAIAILSKLGYSVVGASGKPETEWFIKSIGANRMVLRSEVDDLSGKPLLKPLWAGVIDTVGGNLLATAIKSTQYGGHVTTCGNVSGHEFTTSVYPFILNGITLHGIDSVKCDLSKREKIWQLIATEWKIKGFPEAVLEIGLDGIKEQLDLMLAGKHLGRTIVNPSK